MKILIAQFVFLFLFSNAALAEIYKCVEKNRVTYSNSPCPTGVSGAVLELNDSGKEGLSSAGIPAEQAASAAAPMKGLPSSAASPETLDALRKSLEILKSGNQASGTPSDRSSGASPGMMDAVKKQIELLIRQRDPSNNTVERASQKVEGD
jgi:hypothetical protein